MFYRKVLYRAHAKSPPAAVTAARSSSDNVLRPEADPVPREMGGSRRGLHQPPSSLFAAGYSAWPFFRRA